MTHDLSNPTPAEAPNAVHVSAPWTIATADPDTDMHAVQTVLDDAAAWLVSRGIDQWPANFNEEGGRRMVQISTEAQRGNVLLARHDGEPMGTVTLTDWADPHFAAGWRTGPQDARYVLRLATRRAARELGGLGGMPLGRVLLLLAAQRAQADGVRYLRLDCSIENEELHRYYEAFGFRRVGTVVMPGRRSGALFEIDFYRTPDQPARLDI